MTICAIVYASAVTPIMRRTMMSWRQRKMLEAGVIAKASNKIAVAHTPDQ